MEPRDRSGRGAFFLVRGVHGVKVEAGGGGERVETGSEAGGQETGRGGGTVVGALGHGRERGVTHEYRGRTFESRFLPKAFLSFVVEDELAGKVVASIADAAYTGHESGDGLCWTSPLAHVVHHRTGERLG